MARPLALAGAVLLLLAGGLVAGVILGPKVAPSVPTATRAAGPGTRPPLGARVAGSPPPLAGTLADPATVERVGALVARAYARLDAGDYLGFAALFTPEALLAEFGTANAYEAAAVLAGRPRRPLHRLVSIDVVLVLPGDRLYAEVTAEVGGRPARESAYLVYLDGILLIDGAGGANPLGSAGASPVPSSTE